MGEKKAILSNEKDNVMTAVKELDKGELIQEKDFSVELKSRILFGHKLAIKKIKKGEYVYKYGEIIGRAKKDIEVGEHVHIHNVQDIVDELRKSIPTD